MNPNLVTIKFWGIILFVLGVSLLINSKFYLRLVREFQDEVVRFLYFFVVLVIGAASISVLNQWTLNAAGLVSLLGWASVLKGAFGILFPDLSFRIIQKVTWTPPLIYFAGIILLIVGLYFLFVSFGFFLIVRGNRLA